MKNTKAVAAQEKLVRKEIEKLRVLRLLRKPLAIEDFVLKTTKGKKKLSSFFGDKNELFVIHNMGPGCSYCTLWADGINGMVDHFMDRASIVLVNGETPASQAKFAKSRGWRIPIASARNSQFTETLGFKSETGRRPGISVLRKSETGAIEEVSNANLGPGDLYCSLWHFLDLLPAGANGWGPKFKY